MLFIAELIITLLVGFALGRIWEIRQRIMQAQRVDDLRRPVEIRMISKDSAPRLTQEDRLLALDRAMKRLVGSAAAREGRSNLRAIETRG